MPNRSGSQKEVERVVKMGPRSCRKVARAKEDQLGREFSAAKSHSQCILKSELSFPWARNLCEERGHRPNQLPIIRLNTKETVKDRSLIGSQKWSRICINSSGKRWGGERRVVTTTNSANLIMSDHMGSTINNPRPVINQQVPDR